MKHINCLTFKSALIYISIWIDVCDGRSSTGGSSSSSTGYQYISLYEFVADGPIVYTIWNYILWFVSVVLIAWIGISLLVLHCIVSKREKKQDHERKEKEIIFHKLILQNGQRQTPLQRAKKLSLNRVKTGKSGKVITVAQAHSKDSLMVNNNSNHVHKSFSSSKQSGLKPDLDATHFVEKVNFW